MSLFVDASALVAILAEEPDGGDYIAALETSPDLLWSAMSCWETISALRSSHRWTVEEARHEVELTVAQLPFRLVPIDEPERAAALDAYRLYGRSSGHPAQLNMGDCFAYACAKTNKARLLYKGDDFSHTDLAS